MIIPSRGTEKAKLRSVPAAPVRSIVAPPARFPALDRPGERPVSPGPAGGQGARREDGRGRAGGLPETRSHEAGLHLRGRLQRRRVPNVGPVGLHHGRGPERDGRAGDELTRAGPAASELEAALRGVLREGLDRVERELGQVHAEELGGLREDVVGIVMTAQPLSSAWKMFRTSRVLAQRSSALSWPSGARRRRA